MKKLLKMGRQRTRILAVALAWTFGFASLSAPAWAEYPERVISGIVPFTPGGTTDVMARLFSVYMQKELGQPIIVTNKPGASGNIGVQSVMEAKADGYTLLFCANSMTWNPALFDNLQYDPIKDIVPVALLGESPNLFIVNAAKFPTETLAGFMALVKKNPGKYNVAVSGAGLAENFLAIQYKLNWQLVTYNSSNDSATAVMAGEADAQITSPLSVNSILSTGKIRVLGAASAKRLPNFPDVPTTGESGYPEMQSGAFFGVFVKVGTAPEIVQKLNTVLNRISAMPEVVQKMAALSWTPRQESPAQFAAFYRDDIARWKDVVEKAHIPHLN